MFPSVLVVEDEPEMSGLLAQALGEFGLRVELAHDGAAGLRLAPRHDLVIVDVMMPFMNGFEMVRRLRAAGHQVPVLFLTAREGVEDLVRAFNAGGDDYIVKPFRLVELRARTTALLRRSRQGQDVVEFSDVSLDRRARKAHRSGHALALSVTETALLELFLLRPNELIAKSVILRELWDGDEERDPNIVEAFVRNLRHKLEAGGRARLVHTVRGGGYVLEEREEQP